MSESIPIEAPLVADAFGEFWEKHPIHQSGLDDETLAKFREFAANIWNNARFDLDLKHLSAMDRLQSLGLNPDMHPTLEATVEGVLRMVGNLRKDLANNHESPPKTEADEIREKIQHGVSALEEVRLRQRLKRLESNGGGEVAP